MHDAVIIGSGPNGLVAANILADHGWDVVVLEAQDHVGGGVYSSELVEPGYVNDHCAAFFPLGIASPPIIDLELEKYGLQWEFSDAVVAHAATDGQSACIEGETQATAESLGKDGAAWTELMDLWDRQSRNIISALFTPFPPVQSGAKMAWSMRGRDLVRFARMGVLPVRRLGEERFTEQPAQRLLAGLALHADLLPESALSGFYGWLMGGLGQQFGFPVPKGGASNLSQAMARRLQHHGGKVICNKQVKSIVVRKGRAVAVQCVDGEEVEFRRAVLADVDAPSLYTYLLPRECVKDEIMQDVRNFQWDAATVKIDWTLDAPIPWEYEAARRSGTVHVGEGVDELSLIASELARGVVPGKPFLLLGQQSMTDPTRQPAGKETVWAYTHVPRLVKSDAAGTITGTWDQSELDDFARRMEDEIELRAPGFRKLIRGSHVLGPADFESNNSNMAKGAIGGGTAQLHQQLIFRPVPGWGRPETPVRGVYLASSSAHPGGGVHGACGANAARAAIMHARLRR